MTGRRRSGLRPGKMQDPGKDLFAYLFLLMMVFSLMLLMTMEERYQQQLGPRDLSKADTAPSKSAVTGSVARKQLGRLVKRQGKVYIGFGDQLYRPAGDLTRLEKEGRISKNMNAGGEETKVLYLVEEKSNRILLTEYLSAFRQLSREGITIAFAEVK